MTTSAGGGVFIRNLANYITSLRIVGAVAMVFTAPFSALFWVCYLVCGVSDMIDGAVARALNSQSALGAKLDSIADMVFAIALGAVVLMNIMLPGWLWVCAIIIAVLRLAAYGIGYFKFRTFSALHTYLNKATGALLFAFPLLFAVLGMSVAAIAVSAAAFLSSLEELVITLRARELDRDCKGLFTGIKPPSNHRLMRRR